MKSVPRKKLDYLTEKVNRIIERIHTNTIEDTNKQIHASTCVIGEELGIKHVQETALKEPTMAREQSEVTQKRSNQAE